MSNLKKAKEILKKYSQEHLLLFYDDLSDEEKEYLVNQILEIYFDEIFELYENSKKDPKILQKSIKPLPYFDKSNLNKTDIKKIESIGEKIIKNGEYAIVTMAGGQRNKTWF